VNCPSSTRSYIQPGAPTSPPNCARWLETDVTPWKEWVRVPGAWVGVP
jgi:hypothetical protein